MGYLDNDCVSIYITAQHNNITAITITGAESEGAESHAWNRNRFVLFLCCKLMVFNKMLRPAFMVRRDFHI